MLIDGVFYSLSDLTVFGVTLELAIQRSLIGTDGIELPTVFRLCIDYLEENGKSQYTMYKCNCNQ